MKHKRKLKLFETFSSQEEIIIFPFEEDYTVMDLELEDDFEEYRKNSYAYLKDRSEEVLDVVGYDNQDEWFDFLNDIAISPNNDDLQEEFVNLKEWLSNYDIKEVNKALAS